MIFFKGCSEDFLNLFFSFSFRYIFLVHWSCDHLVIANNVFIIDIYIYIFDDVVITISLISTCIVSFLSLYICFILLYAIFNFCFTLRCFDEFCLKCFRNTGCQNLSCMNSLLAKFFKSLC